MRQPNLSQRFCSSGKEIGSRQWIESGGRVRRQVEPASRPMPMGRPVQRFQLALLFLGTLLALWALAPGQARAATAASSQFRLPAVVAPDRYKLEISPDLKRGTFTGVESVELRVRESVFEIVLNSKGLKISRAVLCAAGAGQGGRAPVRKLLPALVKLYPARERVALRFASRVEPGKYVLELRFDGRLSSTLDGFYRSSYKKSDGTRSWFAATQFEPADARNMFPCFDEPEAKASFELVAVVDENLAAISNMAIKKETVRGGKKVVEFEASPRMSTYLLALVVGEFKSTEPVDVAGVPVRVWCIGRDTCLGTYGRDMAAKLLVYLNDYFGIAYPWGKLDLLAIPDFEAGAMENPGAVTFREKLLLLDRDASLDSRESLASVIAHELAHMWFGNLVTMQWWDDLWLNEAFATWMSVKAVAHVAPEWHFETGYGAERLAGMRTDSMHSTRAIHATVRDPLEARQMFDDITYQKGAAILRMLEVFLGEDKFQSGVKRYMQKHKFSNAQGKHLWEALSQASGRPVVAMMDAWSNRPGYPQITISADESGSGLVASQNRFFLDGSSSREKTLWQVPISLRYIGEPVDDYQGLKPDETILLAKPAQALRIDSAGRPFIANSGGSGFYRVVYPQRVSSKLIAGMPRQFNVVERLSLVGDEFALCLAGQVSLDEYMKMLSACRQETDPLVWETVAAQLHYLDLFVEPSARTGFGEFVRWLAKPAFTKLTWSSREGEPETAKLTRAALATLLGTIGQDREIIDRAVKLFAEYRRSPQAVPGDLVDALTAIVAYNGGLSEYEQVKELWRKTRSPEVEQRNLFALAGFRRPELLRQTANLALSGEVQAQDGPHLLAAMMRNNAGRDLTWTFVRTNWSRLEKRFSSDLMVRLSGSPDRFTSQQKLAEIKQFFAGHKVPGGQSSIARMQERLAINVRFARTGAVKLNDWLRRFKAS